MSIEQHGHNRSLACDVCGTESEPYHRNDFDALVIRAKEVGWKIRLDGNGEYSHTCPDCPEESRLDRARRKFGL